MNWPTSRVLSTALGYSISLIMGIPSVQAPWDQSNANTVLFFCIKAGNYFIILLRFSLTFIMLLYKYYFIYMYEIRFLSFADAYFCSNYLCEYIILITCTNREASSRVLDVFEELMKPWTIKKTGCDGSR